MCKLRVQIRIINARINSGQVKNIYAAKNKVESLKKKLRKQEQQQNWNQYLSK